MESIGAADGPVIELALDTTALLAMMANMPGGSVVGARLRHSAISAVNFSEVLEYAHAQGIDVEVLQQSLEGLGLKVFAFCTEDADFAARLGHDGQAIPLTLSDRACLALASRLGVPALTAEEAWSRLDVDVDIEVLR